MTNQATDELIALGEELAALEDFVQRAYELLLETDHRIPDKQVIIHDHVADWRKDIERHARMKLSEEERAIWAQSEIVRLHRRLGEAGLRYDKLFREHCEQLGKINELLKVQAELQDQLDYRRDVMEFKNDLIQRAAELFTRCVTVAAPEYNQDLKKWLADAGMEK